MAKLPSRQAGITLIGFLLNFMVFGFFVLLFLKIGPIYLEHFKIAHSLQSLKKEPNFTELSREELLLLLQKRWNMNSVDRVSGKDVKITKQGSNVKIQVAYEVVEPILANVDVLVYFDDSVEAGSN